MHHIAIMKKSWGLIPKILSGEKSIESRWYKTRRAPWNAIAPGDTVFFKNAGEAVTAQATVAGVRQFALHGAADAAAIIKKFGKAICLVEDDPKKWKPLPRYAILIFLKDPNPVRPFAIDKSGFGSATARIAVPDIATITKP